MKMVDEMVDCEMKYIFLDLFYLISFTISSHHDGRLRDVKKQVNERRKDQRKMRNLQRWYINFWSHLTTFHLISVSQSTISYLSQSTISFHYLSHNLPSSLGSKSSWWRLQDFYEEWIEVRWWDEMMVDEMRW